MWRRIPRDAHARELRAASYSFPATAAASPVLSPATILKRLKWEHAPAEPLVQKTTWSSAMGVSSSPTGSMVMLPRARGERPRQFRVGTKSLNGCGSLIYCGVLKRRKTAPP